MIPYTLPVAKTKDLNRITAGEIKPTIFSFLNVFKANGIVKTIIVPQKNMGK